MHQPLFFAERGKKPLDVSGFGGAIRLRKADPDLQACLMVGNGRFWPGLNVFDRDEDKLGWLLSPQPIGPLHDGSDIIAAFRTYRILAVMPRIDSSVLMGAIVAPMNGQMRAQLGPGVLEKCLGSLHAQITPEALDPILAEVPPNLEGILQALVAMSAIELSDEARSAITDEVAAGRIPMTDGLKGLGVLTPEERAARVQEEAEFFAPLMPHFVQYEVEFIRFGDVGRCTEYMKLIARLARTYGVTDPAMLVGMSCVFARMSLAHACHSPLSRLFGLHEDERTTMDDLRNAAEFLARQFGPESGRDANSYLGELIGVVYEWGRKVETGSDS
ncbi:MAG: hypothetical protein PHE68_06120 [Candidatus Peribacteraceae bacterium]|nr:hypothetical protein [Candidatus Peribacteraceae bacterium]MDD5075331.1 hypothetical protein [Candidatus Peribacteraceae bacterium]